MTDELCAREGCGAPRAWHSNKSTIADLGLIELRKHIHASSRRPDGECLGSDCGCRAYLAPEPPEPERTAYVVVECRTCKWRYHVDLDIAVCGECAQCIANRWEAESRDMPEGVLVG